MENNEGAASGNNKAKGGSRKCNYSESESSNPEGLPPSKISGTDFQTLDYFGEYDNKEEECAKDPSEGDDDGDNVCEEDNPKEEPTEEEKRHAEAKELANKVREELYTFKMSLETTLADHMSALEARFVHLAELGPPMDSKTCNHIIMMSLPWHWINLIRRRNLDTAGLSANGLYDLLLSLEP